jgi:hypothetical protein
VNVTTMATATTRSGEDIDGTSVRATARYSTVRQRLCERGYGGTLKRQDTEPRRSWRLSSQNTVAPTTPAGHRETDGDTPHPVSGVLTRTRGAEPAHEADETAEATRRDDPGDAGTDQRGYGPSLASR